MVLLKSRAKAFWTFERAKKRVVSTANAVGAKNSGEVRGIVNRNRAGL
jgi:hypothetical protein